MPIRFDQGKYKERKKSGTGFFLFSLVLALICTSHSSAHAQASISMEVPEEVAVKIDKGGSLSEADIKGCKLVRADSISVTFDVPSKTIDEAQSYMEKQKDEIESLIAVMTTYELQNYGFLIKLKDEKSSFSKGEQTPEYQLMGKISYDYLKTETAKASAIVSSLTAKGYKAIVEAREYKLCQKM